MSSPKKHSSKSTSELVNAVLAEEPFLQLRSASGRADTDYPAGTSFENSAARSEAADSAMSPLGSNPTDLDGDQLFAFYPSAGHPSEEQRPNLVDAVIEQLRHAKLRRQRPH